MGIEPSSTTAMAVAAVIDGARRRGVGSSPIKAETTRIKDTRHPDCDLAMGGCSIVPVRIMGVAFATRQHVEI
jgi:hypothetical protein